MEVRKDLENVPGVEADVSLGKVVLRGTVSKPQQWRYLKKTILPSYNVVGAERVVCKAMFRPQDELLLKLKTDLEKSRFKVMEGSDKSDVPGTLSLLCLNNNVFISGTVYSRGDLDLIASVVAAHQWLKLKHEQNDSDDDCYAVLRVTVAPVLLEVDVAFVGVTATESDDIGANLAKNGVSFITAIGAAFHGATTMTVNSGLNGTIQAIAGTGPGRFKSIGHLTFKNDATEWKTYQDGGTITLPIMGANGGVGTQPIDYGLILKAKGGLAGSDEAALELEVELSVPINKGNSPAGPIYDLKRNRISSSIQCPIGKTLIMGGSKQLTEGVTRSGTPVLGKVPLMSFLFSEKTETRDERSVLIMISPQIARAPSAAPALVEQTSGTAAEAEKPLTPLGEKKQAK